MYAFGIDVPLVELVIGFTVLSVILIAEIIAVMVVLMYQLKANRRMMKKTEEIGRVLLALKDKELRLRQLKK